VLPRLWVLILAVLLVVMERPGYPIDRAERAFFERWLETLHPPSTLAPWPDELILVPIDSRAIAQLRGDSSSLFVREHAVRIWDRLHELGARFIINDFQFVSRREQEVDDAVVAALRRNAVLLPITFADAGTPAIEGADRSLAAAELDVPGRGLWPIDRADLRPPLPEFAEAAHALGHVVVRPDPDALVRRLLPALRVAGSDRVVPSIGLVALASVHGSDLSTLRVDRRSLSVDGLRPIPLDNGSLLLELGARGLPPPPSVTPGELFAREPEMENELRRRIEGRVALVFTAVGTQDVKNTALGSETPGGLLLAHGIRAMAAGHAPVFPARGPVLGGLLAMMLLVASRLAKLQPRSIAVLGICSAFLWMSLQVGLYRTADAFLPLTWPILFLLGSGLVLFLHKSLSVVRRMETAEARADAGRAPRGEIALVFTDVQGSTVLWERIPTAMRTALDLHNGLLRKRLEVWRGYEVKTEGDAFMVAFSEPADALGWCLDVQARLLAEEWPEELLAHPEGAQQESVSGALLWRGLRVRMGIHVGTPEPREDPKTGRMDYFGPVVNKAARVAGMAHGGQVIASGTAWEKLENVAVLRKTSVRSLGTFTLKGITSPEPLHEIAGEVLAGRRFASARTTGEHSVG